MLLRLKQLSERSFLTLFFFLFSAFFLIAAFFMPDRADMIPGFIRICTNDEPEIIFDITLF